MQDRLTAIDGKLMVPSPSPASVFVDGIAVSADDAEREARVREAWEALDVDRQRRIVEEMVTVKILPAPRGVRDFMPELIVVRARRIDSRSER